MKQLAAYRSPQRVPAPLTRTDSSKIIVKSYTFLVGSKSRIPGNYNKTRHSYDKFSTFSFQTGLLFMVFALI